MPIEAATAGDLMAGRDQGPDREPAGRVLSRADGDQSEHDGFVHEVTKLRGRGRYLMGQTGPDRRGLRVGCARALLPDPVAPAVMAYRAVIIAAMIVISLLFVGLMTVSMIGDDPRSLWILGGVVILVAIAGIAFSWKRYFTGGSDG